MLTVLGREVALTEGERVLGRGTECDVVIDERSISRTHAMIVVGSAASVIVRDLDSKNGTWVNGMRIASDRRLRHGDRLGLGMIVCDVRFAENPATAPDEGYDDAWLTIQTARLVRAVERGQDEESVFRIGEAFESRVAMGVPFGAEAADQALAAVIEYGNSRTRAGWVRWATAMHAKLGLQVGPAVKTALQRASYDDNIEASGTMKAATAIEAPPTGSVRRRSA